MQDGEVIDDAAHTLRALMDRGVKEANPEYWPFEYFDADSADSQPGMRAQARAQTVSLSPSNVDAIWKCPLKWSLSNRFSGPSSSALAADFGTILHTVAQKAAIQNLDVVELTNASDENEIQAKIAEIAGKLRTIYDHEVAANSQNLDTAVDEFAYRKNQQAVSTILNNIADYFVRSQSAAYVDKQPVSPLVDKRVEADFQAEFSLSDFMSFSSAGTSDELFEALDTLAGGFPQEMGEDLRIRLTGQIDRIEEREGGVQRIIDYKTGKTAFSVSDKFSDLQLICYQLGLFFSEGVGFGSQVDRSMLFTVRTNTAPAQSYKPETLYQPGLFDEAGDGFNGFYDTERTGHYGELKRVFAAPEYESDNQVLREARGTQLEWCLTMLARVFFAAGNKVTKNYIPKRGKTVCQYCAFKSVCPAWPEESRTVLGRRSADG
jgi:hypothetical protein